MAKGAPKGKSSASSNTRKKQANKAAKKVAYETDENGNLLNPELVEALERQKQRGPQRGQKKDKSQKGVKGGKKGKAEKKKQYIPPPKPPQPLPDPLDSMGLASLLPADLVILLRKASKKDVITRCRALEGLLAWVEDALGKSTKPADDSNDNAEMSSLTSEEKKEALVMMLPSWVHLFPRLALSPTRRLRLLTMQIQTLLLEKPQQTSEEASSTRAELLESPQYIEPILGPWAILCHDTDRTIERLGRTAWNDTCTWQTAAQGEEATDAASTIKLDLNEHSEVLMAHLHTILLSPSPSYAFSMTAAHAVASGDPALSRTSSGYATPSLQTGNVDRDAKNRDDSNVEEDTAALDKRLVAGALAVLTSVIRQSSSEEVVQGLQDVLSSRLVWAALSSHNLAGSTSARKDASSAVTSFGFDSPAVRLRAWTLLRALYDTKPEVVDQNIQTIGTVAMTSVWQERDNAVQRATIDAILPLLRKRPDLWLIGASQDTKAGDAAKSQKEQVDSDDEDEEDSDEDDDEEDDDDDEDTSDVESADDTKRAQQPTATASSPKPRAYTAFLQWLQSACGGAPGLGYSAVVVFISTIPAEILPHDDYEAASDLLTNLFSALYSRPLDFDAIGCRAFFAAYTECVTFLALRMLRASSAVGKGDTTSAKELVRVHFGAAWAELVLPKAKILSDLGVTSEPQEADEVARVQRVKSIGSSRVVSDLAVQVRRLASANSDLQILDAFLTEVEAGITEVARGLSQAHADVGSSARAQILVSLEQVSSFYAALAPAQSQPGNVELRRVSASSLGNVIRLAASALKSVANENNVAFDLKRSRANLLVEFLTLLLRAAVSHPDALDPSTSDDLAQAAGITLPQLTGTKSVASSAAATFLAAYLPLCSNEESRASIWTNSLTSVAHLEELSDQVDALSELLAASEAVSKTADADKADDSDKDHKSLLPIPASEAGVEELLMDLVFALCDGGSLPTELRRRLKRLVDGIMLKPTPFVDSSAATSMLKVMASTIEQLRFALWERDQKERDTQTRQSQAAVVVEDLVDSVTVWLKAQPKDTESRTLLCSEPYKDFVTALSDLQTLYYQEAEAASYNATAYPDLARKSGSLHALIWHCSSPERRDTMKIDALESLRDHLLDIQIPVARIMVAARSDIAFLPERKEMEDMLGKACTRKPQPALLIFDPLVSQVSATDESRSEPLFDSRGFGIFSRVCLAALMKLQEDRVNARRHLHLLPYVVILSIFIEDDLLSPGASRHVLNSSIFLAAHQDWLQSSVTTMTAVVSSLCESVTENWHNDIVASLQRSTVIDAEKDAIGHVLSTVWQLSSKVDGASSYIARIFHRLLNAAYTFGTITEAGAERWLKLGDAVSDRMPAMSYAIFYAAKSIAGSSPGYDRLRNGAAAKLAGLGPSTPSDRMLSSLRALVALAPPLDSELSIIPQQRAIFLLKDLQKWYGSDEAAEDPEEEVSTRLAELFIHLLPVVQDVQGSHIDFMFDILETNLEFCSLDQDASLAQLFHTLRLLETMRDFASRNANLRVYWKDRSVEAIDFVRQLFLSLPEIKTISAPKQACIDLIVDLIRETSETPFKLDKTALPLCKLLVQSPSHEVQVISYRLLSSAIREHVKELVVESAVDREALATEEGQNKLKLPEALVANISDSLGSQLNLLVEEEAARRTAFGYFLSWIAVFEHFEGASLAVKSAFLGDLEKRYLMVDSLLPTVFALVGLSDESRRPFDPSRFVLEEVFLDHVDAESSLAVLQVLAAHVYLRALIHVPTTVRSWWVDIKDRQQSMQIASFTTRHCSPVIANRELSHLRQPEALSKLQDEALSIKILSTNEVIATYVVDEHPMEIGVKIPADFPLHGVEIRDIQRVGITEAKWRSWLLAVQQLITGQNGLIFDALSLFKRNAEVQFQGMEECAICYSIISPMDRSLPTKPCKTCKNKFHAGCLFKWISTSGASTCPLCRSIL